jgi:lysylphosphatidylglycerol synthetase-like protein (DUF2156 family)
MDYHLQKLFKKHGNHSLAFSTFQDSLNYFIRSNGYIAYRQVKFPFFKQLILVLGDPVCTIQSRKKIISEFLINYPQAMFVHISKDIATILSELNFYINKIGNEHKLELKSFAPTWNSYKFYKTSLNKLKQFSFKINEVQLKDCCEKELESISKEWIKGKVRKNKQSGFLIKPLSFKENNLIRVFCAFDGVAIIGYRFFYPIYNNNKIIAYLADGYRLKSNYPNELTYGLLEHALKTFRNESISYISLGLAPFSKMKTHFKKNVISHILFMFLYNYGNRLFPFKGISFHKQLFTCSEDSIFIASRKKIPCLDLLAVYFQTFKK